MTKLIGAIYRKILKPIFFLCDAERVHDTFIFIGFFLGQFALTRYLTRLGFYYEDPILETRIGGLRFKNPIGLAAGFDKNGKLLKIVPAVGFGFMEVGSVTARSCTGNPRPRLWRLPEQKSLIVNYGLANDGAEAVAKRFSNKVLEDFQTGASVAMTNCQENLIETNAIADYVRAFVALEPVADFLTVNISCPNARGGKTFLNPESLDRLLQAIDQIPTTKMIFLKIGPDLSLPELDRLLDVVMTHRVSGLVCSNLTKKGETNERGGLSGRSVFTKSNEQIAHCYKKVGHKMIIVGCGGVMSADDAYQKIKLGASLVQLVTGMIYEGPQLIGEINRGLARRLKADGFRSISEAVGSSC